jgi:ELWxxDGT repeat protein
METNLSMSNPVPIKSRYASLKSKRKDASRNQSVFGRLLLDQTKRRLGFEILDKRAVFNATMVVDVNDYPTGLYPSSFFSAGDHVFFSANHPYAGNELWKSDGTPEGTSIVKDIWPGIAGGVENFLAEANGTVYFRATENYHGTGYELWRSDGTDAGTSLVKDIHVGPGHSLPENGCNLGGTLYFTADDGTNGRELWKSDGTEAGTVLVKDINSAVGSDPFGLVAVGSVLFFIADDGSGRQVWKSDGTDEGTIPVTDATGVGYITVVGGVAYFSSNDGSHGYELWRSDGTADGTVMVKDIGQGVSSSRPDNLTNVGGVLFFRAYGGDVGWELWRSDGTADGTFMVKDIQPGFGFSGFPQRLTNVNGKLFFYADDGVHGGELWISDGTDQGTEMIQDIHPSGSSNIAYLTNVNGTLFFRADDGATGEEIWSSDGIPGRASRVKDIFVGGSGSNPKNLRNLNGSLLFSATANESISPQVWISNGSDSTTRQITNVVGSRSSGTNIIGNQKSTVYFTASDASNSESLWKADGNATSSKSIKDLKVLGSFAFTELGDQVFFVADDGIHGQELWRSDGTESGTVLVKDIQLPGVSFNTRLCNVNGTLFFFANDGTNGRQLWKSDGTETGTEMVTEDSRLGALGPQLRLVSYKGMLLFGAAGDKDLWISDGTSSGTNPIKSFDNGSLGSSLGFTISNGIVFFQARTNETGNELWKTDGTPEGTQLVRDIHPGGNWSNPRELTDASGVLYFLADNGTNGVELWKSDGTLDGTQLVKDIRSGSDGSFFLSYLTNVNGTVYFSANDGTHGFELWKSNGTVDGTVLVQDIAPGNKSSSPRDLKDVNGTLYFASDDGTRGRELWQNTDGGTEIVADIAEGSFSSGPSHLINVNGQLYFGAANNFGRELWTIDGPSDIHLSSDTLPENRAVHTIVGQLNSSSNSPSDTFVYTLVVGAGDRDNGFFSVEGSNLLANHSFDFESQSNYTVRVRSTDQDGFYLEESFGIWVTDINEAPTSITISSSDLLENAGVNAVIGALSTVDPDAGNTFTYTLVAGTGDGDNSAFNIDGNNLRANASFDFETKSSYTIRVRSTDQGGLFTEKAFTISVLDVNETPTDIALSPTTIPENAGVNAVVGAMSTVDPDVGNTFTYTLVAGTGDGDNSAFNIDGNNLRANASFDFETNSSYTVRVRSTDQGGLFTEKAFTISVLDVNETPTDIDLTVVDLEENAGPNAVVGALSTLDPDAGNTFTYTLVAGTGDGDNSAFNIDGNNLRAIASFDFETKSSYTVRVRSTDQGGLFTEKAFTISVLNVNETPVDIDLSSTTIPENAGMNAVVGALSTVDPDVGNTFTYTLVAGTGDGDNGAFNIDGNNLRANASFDFETKSSYTVRVRLFPRAFW